MAKSLDQQLVDAAGWHRTDADVRELIERGADPKSPEGDRALGWAAATNKLASVILLLDKGANVDSHGYPQNTPLMHAANAAIAKVLLDHGARVDGCDHQMMGDALHRVMDRGDDVELAALLLDHGLKPLRYLAGASPGRLPGHLEKAIGTKRTRIEALLLERGCGPGEVTHRGDSLIGHALYHSETSVVALFERGATATAKDLEIACARCSPAMIALVLQHTTGDATRAAEAAAGRGDLDMLRILIESERVERLDALLRAAARNARAPAVELLLHCGADPTARDEHGSSSVHAAAYGGSIELLDRFLALGCSIDVDGRGRTLLHHAACGKKPVDMLRELVRRGVDLEARDRDRATAMKLCATALDSPAYDTLRELGAEVTDDGERDKAVKHREWMESKY